MEIPEFPQNSEELVEESIHAKNALKPSSHFYRTLACDHKHREKVIMATSLKNLILIWYITNITSHIRLLTNSQNAEATIKCK